MSIAQLTLGTDISRQVVTRHLQVLADAGLLSHLRAGRERRCEFEAARLEQARRSLDAIAQQWDQALGKLKRFVESRDEARPRNDGL